MSGTKAAKRQAKRFLLYEDIYRAGAQTFRVDEEARVIYRVKILGWESDNGRRYLPESVDKRLYEGAKALCDHPGRPGEQRKVRELLGVFRNIAVEQDGVYADLHYYASHPMAGTIVEEAKRGLCGFGFSHNAEGDGYREPTGSEVINRITKVNSVDLVLEPATVSSLRESRGKMKTTFRKWLESGPGPAKVRLKLLEMADEYKDKPEGKCMEAEMDEPGDGDPMEAVISAIAALAKTGDPAHHDLAMKLMKLIKPEETTLDEEDEPSESEVDKTKPKEKEKTEETDDDKKDDEKDKKESRRPRPAVAKVLSESICRNLCEGFGIKAESDLLQSMKSLSLEGATALLGTIKKNLAGKQPQGPRSQRTFTEQRQQGPATLPKTVDEAIALYRRA